MKIEKKVSTSTDMFGNLDIGDLFESHGLLYMKLNYAGQKGNACRVGVHALERDTFGGETRVHPVTTLTYSLD